MNHGLIVRIEHGPTAFIIIDCDSVNGRLEGGAGRFYGELLCGGNAGAYSADCRLPTARELEEIRGYVAGFPESRKQKWLAACEATTEALHKKMLRKSAEVPNENTRKKIQKDAADFLTAALSHMQDRAATYDKPQGERSMGKTVAAFNNITGHLLTEEQGWLLMGILKMVRSQQGNYKADNYEDEAAYAALRGECASRERSVQ